MKTALFEDVTGSIQPVVGTNTITIPDYATPMGFIITTDSQNDKVLVVRRNGKNTGWEPVTDGDGNVYLSAKRLDVTLSTPDTYGLQGYVKGTLSAYSVV